MWLDYTKTVLTKLKVTYNNSLRRFIGLPSQNSGSEMFVNLNIRLFGELLRVFVRSFRSRIVISGNFMLASICNSLCIVCIRNYKFRGQHHCMFICDSLIHT